MYWKASMVKKKRRLQQDPVSEWNAATREYDVEEALELLELLEDAPSEIWDKAYSFFESIQSSAQNMAETLHKTNTCSRKQWETIENWIAGVKKWGV